MKRLSRGSKLNKGRRNVYCRAASVSRIFAHSVCHKLLKSVAAMAAMAAMVPTALTLYQGNKSFIISYIAVHI